MSTKIKEVNDKPNLKDYKINKTFDWGSYSHDLEKWGEALEKENQALTKFMINTICILNS